MEPIIGIDLGTTNSEVSFIFDGIIEVIKDNDNGIVPSCVGLNESGNVIVGIEAFNQALVVPEKTIMSVKRLMGTEQQIKLGESFFTPQEISAFILKALKERAEKKLCQSVSKAVITVPAYFTDAQRQATREAGEIAGLQVTRIINEPTAASLAYESSNPETRRILVFDLGGGTFDVSIVKIEEGVVEVLSSTGDNHLGGDDFDWKIVDHLAAHIRAEHDIDVKGDVTIMARLKRAAENAKIELSSAPFSVIEEDHIAKKDGKDIHLSLEFSRIDFEAIIEADLSRTMESVTKAMKDAGVLPSAIEKIILVGGSTRIPMVSDMLEQKIGHLPHSEIDPDLCVAVGAGMQAASEMGVEGSGVLIDVTPYTFGTSVVGEINGRPTQTKAIALIRRNTKLPARKSEVFFTMYDSQDAVDVRVFQGEAPDALDNILLGNYLFHLTDAPAGNEIVLNFDLDLNGILKIKAVEKKTGKEISAVIENAMSRFSGQELVDTQNRINGIWSGHDNPGDDAIDGDAEIIDSGDKLPLTYEELINRAMAKISDAAEDDRDEIINIIEDIRDAAGEKRWEDADASSKELDDILFYLG